MKFSLKQEKEHLAIAIFFCFWILYALFGEPDFAINDYSKLYLSQATQDNVDISKRVGLFYRSVFSLLILLPLLFFALRKLTIRLRISSKQLQFSAITSLTGSILIFSDLMGVENERGIEFFFILTLLSLVLSVLSRPEKRLAFLKNQGIFAGVLTLSVLFISAIILLFNSSTQIPKNINAWYFVCCVILLLVISFLHAKRVRLRSIFNYFVPLAWTPLLVLISVESFFYFKINHSSILNYKGLFLVLLAAVYLIYFLYKRLRPKKISFQRLFTIYLAPAALLSYVILAYYSPIISQPEELFEFANPAISQMRIFHFGEIPFVDFMSSHMFSEQFYGIIYNLIFGYNGTVDFYVYNFLYIALFYLVAYYFIIRIIKSPFVALLILLTFPFVLALFSVHVFFGILVFFAAKRLLERQTALRYLLLFAILTLLIIWRLDTGASALLTALLFVPLSFFVERKKIVFSALLKGTGFFLGIVVGAVVLFALVRSPEQLMTNLKVALHYITANQAHGYSKIAYQLTHQFYVHHFLLPAIGGILICVLIFQLSIGKFTESPTRRYSLSGALFLYLLFIMNFQRGLVRHGYMESNDYILTSTFFLATALVVLSFIPWRDLFSKYSIFFGFSFFLILILKNFAIDKGPAPLENFLKTANIASLDEECKNGTLVGRVIANHDFASKNYTELKQFLDEYLTDEQTFLNFSSTPMLYYYCQRRVPAYFCQNHQNTVDDFLQLDHLNRINPEDVPIVFTDGPIVWQFAHPRNSSDGVLHSMRQYLISEYIYKNYQPIGSINKQTVWASKFIDIPEEIIDVNLSIDNSYLAIFGNFAAAIDNHFFRDGSVKLKRIKTSVATNEDEELDIFSIDDSVRDSSIFIRLHIQNPMDDREITVTTVDVDGKPLGNMTFNCIEGQKTYTLFLSNYYLWYHRTPKFLKIPKWSGMIINKVEFYKDERTEPTHN